MRAAVLSSLPLVRWASRFAGGTVVLTGRLVTPLALDLDGEIVPLEPGPLRLDVRFIGGPGPTLAEVYLDGRELPPSAGVAPLLDVLHDAAVDARAWTDTDLLVKMGHGLEARVAAGDDVRLRAVAVGPPEAPRLVEVVEARIGGSGVRLSLRRARWLAALARVRISRAALHPDGQVDLEGSALGLLKVASRRLSELVRRSPRFAGVRAFLRPS